MVSHHANVGNLDCHANEDYDFLFWRFTMRPRQSDSDVTDWGLTDILLDFSSEGESLGPLADALLANDTDVYIDSDVTPSVDTVRELERVYASEGRWNELVTLFIERAGSIRDSAEHMRCLIRAAQVFDTNMGDVERAFVILLAALKEDPSHDGVAAELARLAAVHGRWDLVMGTCKNLFVGPGEEKPRAELLVTMSLWEKDERCDSTAAERCLEDAMSADPSNPAAVRALVLLHGQRGDWHRAAAYLTCAAGSTVDPMDSVELSLDAAEIYRHQLHDMESAAVQYLRVLDIAPNHPKAIAALADAAWERKDWAVAFPLLEGMAGSTKHAMEESADLWHRAAWSAQMAGDVERARDDYRKAFAISPTHLPTLRAWSRLAGDWGFWQDVVTTVPRLLSIAGDSMTGDERAGHLMQLGQAFVALRDLETGVAKIMEALRLSPDLPGARQALAKATAQMEGRGPVNAAVLVEQYRVLLHGPLSTDERFDIVCKIGRLQREELDDPSAALGTYLQAREMRPDDVGVLHELVEIHSANHHWSRAVDTLDRLVALTTGREKVCYLVALASILNAELDSPDEAVALYDRALDENPSDPKLFERVERLLVERRKWRELTRAYRRMIKRLGPSPAEDKRAWLLTLWRALADTCRRYLSDIPAATAAYEVCVSLDPNDASLRAALAEVYEDEDESGKAIAERGYLLARATSADEAARQIRSLSRLHGKHRRYDQVFCASAALCALTKADAREQAFYQVNAPKGVPLARTVLTEKQWQGRLCPSLRNQMIAQVLAAVVPGVIIARAKDPAELGIERGHRAKIERDPAFVSRLLVYASRLLGVALPPVFVPPGGRGEVDLVILLDGGKTQPALVLGRDLVVGRSQPELAFFLTKKLVGLRADHLLLWPQLVPSLGELQVIFAAAIKLVHPKFDPSASMSDLDSSAVRKYLAFFDRVLPQTQRERIAGAAAPLLSEPGTIDIAAWIKESDQIANRAGLVACSDVVSAAREIVRDARASHTRPEERILDLVRWSMSNDYLDLRAQLGLALVAAEAREEPVAHSFSELGGLFDREMIPR